MRLRFTAALLAAFSIPIGTVHAADAGTYRPGDPYLQVPAQKPCQGDALCRGWNFVHVDRHRAICEFNVRSVSPIHNAYSVSGDNGSGFQSSAVVYTGYSAPRMGSRSVFQTQLPGNTVRVGEIPKPKLQLRRVVQRPAPVRQAPFQTATQRRAANQPAMQTTMRRTAPQATRPSPSFRHVLDQAPGSVQTTPQAQPVQRKFVPQLDTHEQAMPMAQAPQLPAQSPRLSELVPPPISEAVHRTPVIKADPGLAGAPTASGSTSLFGSLYDDVKAPRSLTYQDIADPDAPIPTVNSVPIAEIRQSPL